MIDYNAILDQAANTPTPAPSVTDVKKQSLATVSDAKKVALSGTDAYAATVAGRTGYGIDTLTGEAKDLATMDNTDLYLKYGPDRARELISMGASASGQVSRDNLSDRSNLQAGRDVGVDVVSGAVNGVGGIGALGLGMIDPTAGNKAAELLNQATQWGQSLQSDSLAARRHYAEVQTNLAEADSQAIFDASPKNLSDTLAHVGRDVISSVKIGASDGQTLSSGIGQGIGSMAGVGPTSKIVTGLGKLAISAERNALIHAGAAASKAAGELSASRGLAFVGEHAPGALAVGAQSSGGIYTSTIQDAMEMMKDHTDLTQADKEILANKAALDAAATGAPLSIAAGALVAKFEASPFAKVGVRTALRNMGKETAEEFIQSAAEQGSQNKGIQDYVDPTRDIAKGVGTQAGQGALYGLGTAGAVSVPAVSRAKTEQAANAVAMGVDKVLTRAEKLLNKLDENSPVSDKRVTQAVNELSAVAPEAVSRLQEASAATENPEEKAQLDKYTKQVTDFDTFDASTLPENTPPQVKAILDPITSRIQAVTTLAGVVGKLKGTAELGLGNTLLEMMNSYNDLLDQNDGAIANLPDGHPADTIMKGYLAAAARVSQTPIVAKALQNAQELSAKTAPATVTEESMATPEGQADIQANIAVAQMAPENINVESVDLILKQAGAGKLDLTPRQLSAMKSAAVLMKAAIAANEKQKVLGLSPLDKVSDQIQTDQTRKGANELSALSHVQRIRAATDSGNLKDGKAYLEDFMKFAAHMQNKVGAINTAFESGIYGKAGNQNYLSLGSDREFSPSKSGLGVTPQDVNSVKFAQRVSLEAERLGGIVNGLAEAYPQLGVKPMALTSLDENLVGMPGDVASEFKSGIRTNPHTNKALVPAPVAQAPAAPVTPEPKVEASAKTTALDQLVLDKKAKTIGGVTYISDATDSRYVAGTTKEGQVYVNLGRLKQDGLLTYIQNSAQKKAVLEAMGITAEQFVSLFDTSENLKQVVSFLRNHELSHIENQDRANYPIKDGKLDLMDPKAIAIGVRATRDGLTKDQLANLDKIVEDNIEKATAPEEVNPLKSLAGSKFAEAFTYAKTMISRVTGSEKPLKDIHDALASTQTLEEFTDVIQKGTLDSEVATTYQRYIRLGNTLKSDMKAALAEFAKNKNIHEAFMNENKPDPTSWVNGKQLGITREENGVYTYDESLLDAAILAALQWRITAMERASVVDERDASKILGIPEEEISADHLATLKNSIGHVEGLRALATKITQYWGVKTNPNTSNSFVEGIPLGVAAQIFDAMVKREMITETKLTVLGPDGKTAKSPIRYTLVNAHFDKTLRTYPDAIEQAVAVEPEETHYLGDSIPPTAKVQMRNAFVENTPEALKAIEAEGNTPFFANMPLANMYFAMGMKSTMSMFGEKANPETTNINHLKTLEGRNTNLAASFQSVEGLIAQMANQAKKAGVPTDEYAIRYAYNMSKVNRQQQLGRFGPQASKFVRELLLPTRSTLDLTKATDKTAFGLALAQALGIKVHTQSLAKSNEQVFKDLEGKYEGAVEAISGWLKDYSPNGESRSLTEDEVNAIKERLGSAFSPVAVHAVMEYARYKAMTEAERKSFTTSLYVEADGVTNGPVSAMMLMTTGEFTSSWINNVRKGGYFIGLKDMTMNMFRGMKEHDGHVDLYQATADHFKKALKEMRNFVSYSAAITKKMDSIQSLMTTFLPDQISQDDKGNLTINRSLTKNPLTVIIYGAGVKGVASKISSNLLDAIYAKMSMASERMSQNNKLSWGEAMFGTGGEAKFNEFIAHLNNLSDQVVRVDKEGNFFIEETPTKANNRVNNPKEFTFNTDQIKNITDNLQALFVNPLRGAISETLGKDVMNGVSTIQKATQIQSIFMRDAFLKILEGMKATKPKGEFLSQVDLKKAMEQLHAMNPLVQTESQNYFIAGRDGVDDSSVTLASSFEDRYRMPAMVYGPQDAGVKGIPFLVIGMGDGAMMQRLSTMFGGPKNTLKIFDGMNMKLSTITEDSRKANEAVHDSWQGNPFAAVSESFNNFILNGSKDLDPDSYKELARIFEVEKLDEDTITSFLKMMGNNLKYATLQADIRKQVLAEYSISVDQMASVAAAYQTEGTKEFSSTDPEKIAAELNEAYNAKVKEQLSGIFANDEIAGDLAGIGRKNKDGTRTLTVNSLKTLNKELKIPSKLQAVFNQVLSNLASKDYTIIYGTPEQLAHFAGSEEDIADVNKRITKGWTNIGTKTVYLVTPSAETLVHELVHVSTFEILLDFYNGYLKGELGEAVSLAVRNLEGLMDQFLNSKEQFLTSASPELQKAYNDARAAIKGFATAKNLSESVAKAAALNEFMAWALANQNLNTILGKTKVNPLFQLAQKAIQMIKKVIFGKKITPTVGTDMFSNLLFNSAVVMAAQKQTRKTTESGLPQIKLKQAGSTDDPRLDKVRQTFDDLLTDRLQLNVLGGLDTETEVVAGLKIATDMALDAQITGGFSMNLQQSTTMQAIVAALATQAKIDPSSMSKAQDLYAQVSKALTIEDFMADPASQDPNMRADAQAKYEWVMGQKIQAKDTMGRSSLLPNFLALGIVSDEFREVLSKIAPEKAKLNKWDSANNVIENLGMNLVENLSSTLSGTKKAPSVQAAIDALTRNIADIAERQENIVATTVNNATGKVDAMNSWIVEGINNLSDYVEGKAEKLARNNPNSKIAKAIDSAATFTGLIVSDEKADSVARGVMTGLNRMNIVRPVRDLITDMVGRTSTNAIILDMIKKVRSVVAQDRQAYRENIPTVIASKFSRQLLDKEWSAAFRGLSKTDLPALIMAGRNRADTLRMLVDPSARSAEIARIEGVIMAGGKANGTKFLAKSQQLAEYMTTGKPGVNLLRNSYAISQLWDENPMASKTDFTNEIEQLVSLYAIEKVSADDMVELAALVKNEPKGMDFALAYLQGQREEENRKAELNPMAKANAYKGYIPSEQKAGLSLIVADDTQAAKLRLKGYIRTGDYVGSSLESNFNSKGYYFSPVGGKGSFSQGLVQNVNQTAGGVDLTTGLTIGTMTVGNVVDPLYLAKMIRRMGSEVNSTEPLMPVRDANGKITSFERSVDPAQLSKLKQDTHLGKMIGVWRGRQVEEVRGQEMNYVLVDNLKKMYEEDIKTSAGNRDQYIDLFAKNLDPVMADAMKLINQETIDYIKKEFGPEFLVRKDAVNDVIGYRAASVRDLWSGVSYWDTKTQKVLQRALITAMGIDAYKYVVNAETILQNYVKDAKVLIVMKSVIVPAGNLVSNMIQLLSRGVSPVTLVREMPRKTAEVNAYVKARVRYIEAEAELRAANGNPLTSGKLQAEMKSIEDSYTRLSIWPLLQAGEFTAISDTGISREEILLSEGKITAFLENAVSKLPESMQTSGKYALITKDTALFQAVQKATEYGDFLAKAILYDHLIARGKTEEEALGQISEEYVNYDRLPGRFRGALESNGLVWFWNFKIRSVKVAASMIRNNPLQTLMAGMIPTLPLIGHISTVTDSNFVTKLFEGSLGSSMGLGQGLRAPQLYPWWNLVS